MYLEWAWFHLVSCLQTSPYFYPNQNSAFISQHVICGLSLKIRRIIVVDRTHIPCIPSIAFMLESNQWNFSFNALHRLLNRVNRQHGFIGPAAATMPLWFWLQSQADGERTHQKNSRLPSLTHVQVQHGAHRKHRYHAHVSVQTYALLPCREGRGNLHLLNGSVWE